MATGSGKTFAAANICERLIRHAQAKRILFLVDRAQPGQADPQGVPGLRGARLGPEVHRALQRAAPDPQPGRPGGERVHRHDPARLLDAARRGRAARGPRRGVRLRAGPRPAGRGRLQPGAADRGVRRDHRRRVPPLDLRGVAPGARVLRRLPHRAHRHAGQADVRVLQQEPGHGVRLPRRRWPTA